LRTVSEKDSGLEIEKALKNRFLRAFAQINGRCERIRTFYPLHPIQEKACFAKSSIVQETKLIPLKSTGYGFYLF